MEITLTLKEDATERIQKSTLLAMAAKVQVSYVYNYC